jgi:hypothetical protein
MPHDEYSNATDKLSIEISSSPFLTDRYGKSRFVMEEIWRCADRQRTGATIRYTPPPAVGDGGDGSDAADYDSPLLHASGRADRCAREGTTSDA